MAYQDDIRSFWNWLPAFRAVAESEHLPTAAKRVHLTAAALSRTVRLLEDELQRPLFMRRGRGLHLNDDGRLMLEAVRTAMRVVHDAQREVTGQNHTGVVRIAAGGVSRAWVTRAITEARRAYPGLQPHLLTPDPATAHEALLRGELDLVFGSFVVQAVGLVTEPLWEASSSVYCGPPSTLFGRTDVTVAELATHGFVTPPPTPHGTSVDGWPDTLPRFVAAIADRMDAGMQICANSELLAVLPDAIASQSSTPLHRLPLGELLPSTPVIAIYREPSGSDDLTARVLDAIRAERPS